MNNDGQMVERVVYLSSLVSDKKAIDPMLDILRFVTARRANNVQQLSPEDRAKIQQLESQLNDYLTTKEPVRAFTKESLQAQMAQHFRSNDPRATANRATRRQIFGIFGLAILSYILGVAAIPSPLNARFSLAVPLFMLVLSSGIAWMFWSGRKALVTSIRPTYALFAGALIISAACSAQYPVLSAYPQSADWDIFRYGGFIPPFLPMYVLFYAAFYRYARQLRAHVTFLRPWWMIFGAALLVEMSILLPHPPTANEAFFDLTLACFMLNVWFSAAAAILGLRVIRQTTERYQGALRPFAYSIVAYVFVSSGLAIMLLLTGILSPADPRVSSISALYTVALILQIRSAYLFKRNIQE